MKAAQSLTAKLIRRKRDLRGGVKGNKERNRAKEKEIKNTHKLTANPT